MISKICNSRFFRRAVLSALVVSIGLLTQYCLPAAAQEVTAYDKLRRAVNEAKQELESERTRIEREDQAFREKLGRLNERLTKLADELVNRKLALANKRSKLEQLRQQRAVYRQRQGAYQQQRTEMHLIASDAQMKLKDFLETLPPSENRAKQKQLLEDFKKSFGQTNDRLNYVFSLLELLESLYRESHSSAVFSQTIRDGQGDPQEAEILRVGHILYAYKSAASRRTGVAVSGPEGEKGYRWNENLPEWATSGIAAAIESNAEDVGMYRLPIDVTQGLAAQRQYGSQAFWKTLSSGGVVMIPLGLVATLAVCLIFERIFYLQRYGKQRGTFAERVFAACHAGNFDKALNLTQTKRGVIPRVLCSCLSHRHRGTAVMEDSVQEAILHELPGLERFLSAIGILAGVAPLLGLLGTVTGMIATFNAITVFGSGEPRLMAGGISEALLTTAAGLVIAIPILFVHSVISSRVEGLIADMERFSATLLNLIHKESGTQEETTKTTRPQT